MRPFLKNADKDEHDPKNYRTISLLNSIFKLYEAIIHRRLMKKLENDLELKDREVIKSREEILHLKNEILNEKARSEAAANILAKKTKAMTEKVNVLNDRCERVSHKKKLIHWKNMEFAHFYV